MDMLFDMQLDVRQPYFSKHQLKKPFKRASKLSVEIILSSSMLNCFHACKADKKNMQCSFLMISYITWRVIKIALRLALAVPSQKTRKRRNKI
jgi:hypothetical protein